MSVWVYDFPTGRSRGFFSKGLKPAWRRVRIANQDEGAG